MFWWTKLVLSSNIAMDRVSSANVTALKIAIENENSDLVKENSSFLCKKYLPVQSVDVLDLLEKGVINKCFSCYGYIPSSLSSDYIPIRYVDFLIIVFDF